MEEWLVKIVESMYSNAQSRIRVNGIFSDDFNQDSVLVQLALLLREFRSGRTTLCRCLGNSETLEGLKGRLESWKGALKSKGLRVDVKKTKLMIRG